MSDSIEVVSVRKQKEKYRGWLQEVYDPDQLDDEHYDNVFKRLDGLLLDGDFEAADLFFEVLVDDFMAAARVQLDDSLCLLIISNGGQDKLPSRQMFYQKLEEFIEQHPEHEVNPMLGGLE